ncbi:MAG: hypothetical protein EBQ92_01300 [Proteobacteria bacterium]|nr:hypothetical protein [Pseudomonadota bacterium]
MVSVLVVFDYLTFPFRIMNHYTLLLFILLNQGVWFSHQLKGEDLDDAISHSCKKFNLLILGVAFLCAGLHKVNSGYLDPIYPSNTVVRLFKEFFPVLGLQSTVPEAPIRIFSVTSIVIEVSFIFLILFKREKNESYIVLILLLFLSFLLLVKRIPDYTWIASCFSPLFFSEKKWQRIEKDFIPSGLSLLWFIAVSLGISILFFRHLEVKMLLYIPVVLFFCCLINAVIRNLKLSEC